MNQKIELEACPNCGEDAPNAPEMSKVYNGVVICPECGMSGYIEYWQHRPIEDALREENKKLKEIVNDFVNGFDLDIFGVLPNGNEALGCDEGVVRGSEFLKGLYDKSAPLLKEPK